MESDTRNRSFRKRQLGQGFLEFALILPVLLLITWGIIEFGRMFFIYTEVSNAAREAVRFGVARGTDPYADPNYLNCQGIRDAGMATVVLTPLQNEHFAIAYDHGGGPILGTCADQPGNVRLGDRLLITVTYQLAPLILFQDAGPFAVQFHTARTIVHEGIPMGDAGSGGLPPGGSPSLGVTYGQDACAVSFSWTYDGDDADGFNLYRISPLPVVKVNGPLITGNTYPTDGSLLPVANGQIYYVRAVNDAGEGSPSNPVTISGCTGLIAPPNLEFTRTGYFPCSGYFTWDEVPDAAGYRVYRNGSQIGDGASLRFPATGEFPVADGEEYQVKAYKAGGQEGPAATLTIDSCTPPPLSPPTGLSFTLNQAFLPCNGHFTWNAVDGAEGYRVYQNGVQVEQVTTTRYPAASNTYVPVLNGDQYNVTAFHPLEETAFSDPVIVSGCSEGGQMELTFYLHSNPTPPVWHGNAPPPLVMDPTAPAHANLYNYNGTDPSKPGRNVTKNGGTPPGETNPTKYLEWRGGPYAEPLTLLSNATLTIWGRNSLNQDVTASYYLYNRNGSTYTLLGSATYSWPNKMADWAPASVNLGGAGHVLQPGHQLVVWVISDGLKDIEFAYDTTGYPSRLEFTGEW